ncbi:MAG: IS110 family transposase [Mesorhizobium sp.]|nr:MAG: IS110 family transposase [Mesorhizobium sp.]
MGAIEHHLGFINQIEEALTVVEADVALHALQDPTIRGLMTLPGLDTVAASAVAVIGNIRRLSDAQRLAAYLGPDPSGRQSGEGPVYHGRITKQGRGHGRGMPGRGGLGGCALAGSSARLLQAARFASREVYRGRRHRAQICNDHLAHPC